MGLLTKGHGLVLVSNQLDADPDRRVWCQDGLPHATQQQMASDLPPKVH
jgi:hypothetical protein